MGEHRRHRPADRPDGADARRSATHHVLTLSASLNLSIRLQAIAQALEDTLNEAAGEPCAFVLVLQADGVAQYVSNCDRKDGRELIESLFSKAKDAVGILEAKPDDIDVRDF